MDGSFGGENAMLSNEYCNTDIVSLLCNQINCLKLFYSIIKL